MRAILLLALAGLALVSSPAPALPARNPIPACADRGCKPLAPIAVVVAPRGDGAGPVVTLDVAVRPLLEMQVVGWHWELSPGVVLLQGESAQEAAAGRGALTEATVELAVPTDGRYASATLVVSGVFHGQDELGVPTDEMVQVARTTSWGQLPAPAPLVPAMDGESGARVEVVALPVAQRAGR
jgi:hypothetical protein